jgi:holo-[acyl-carrier protein] synthase
VKAVGRAKGLSFQGVSVAKDQEGKPYFEFTGESEQTIKSHGISQFHLSLSHDGNLAVAYVIAEVAN